MIRGTVVAISACLCVLLIGCGGQKASGGASTPTSVTIAPATASLASGGSQVFTAIVANDSAGAGVTWSLGSSVGSISTSSITSATYIAPTGLSATTTATLTATSRSDTTKSASVTITITATPVSVSLTPTTSTISVGIVSILFYVMFTLISENLLAALIGSVGLMIAFYYGLTGFACAWYYRHSLTVSVRDFVMRGVVPLLGGVGLLLVLIYGLIQYARPEWLTDDEDNDITILGFGAVAAVGIGALVLGLILMVVWWAIAPGFFRGRTITRGLTGADSGGNVVQPAGR